MNKKKVLTIFAFLLFSAFWGAAFPITKSAIQHFNLFLFLSIRFIFAALIILPFVFKEFRNSPMACLKAGAILGVLNSLIYSFEALSLHSIPASQCAFITGANIILVPFLGRFLKVSRLTFIDIFAGLVCFTGLFILTGVHI